MKICPVQLSGITSLLLVLQLLLLLACSTPTHMSAEKEKKSLKDQFEKDAQVGRRNDESYIVPTSQIIDPAGTTITFPGRPVDLALNKNETILAVKNINNLVFFNTSDHSIKQTLKLAAGGNSFTGIGWSDNDNKVWTTDEKGFLRSAKVNSSGAFTWADAIQLPANDNTGAFPGGFAIDDCRKTPS